MSTTNAQQPGDIDDKGDETNKSNEARSSPDGRAQTPIQTTDIERNDDYPPGDGKPQLEAKTKVEKNDDDLFDLPEDGKQQIVAKTTAEKSGNHKQDDVKQPKTVKEAFEEKNMKMYKIKLDEEFTTTFLEKRKKPDEEFIATILELCKFDEEFTTTEKREKSDEEFTTTFLEKQKKIYDTRRGIHSGKKNDLLSVGPQSSVGYPVDDTVPPSYDVVLANKYADLCLTLQPDVSRISETTRRIEQTSYVTVKSLIQLTDQLIVESNITRQRHHDLDEQLRDMNCSMETLHTKLNTVLQRRPDLWDNEEFEAKTMRRQLVELEEPEETVELDNNTSDDSCLYHCKRCRCRRQCPCQCHRGNRRKTNSNEMKREKEYLGDIPDLQSKSDSAHDAYHKVRDRERRKQVGSRGGNPGGSSENLSDSSDGEIKMARKRNKVTSKWKRGDAPDSGNDNAEFNDLKHRLETYKKRKQRRIESNSSQQQVGACGGNPGDSPDDPSDDSDDSKRHGKKWQGHQPERKKGHPMWTIDCAAWRACIDSGNTDKVIDLLRRRKLPDNMLLNDARKKFAVEIIDLICDEICKYIVQKTKDIIFVYPSETTNEQDACNITFVAILAKDTYLGNEFEFHKINITDPPSSENAEIRRHEKETRAVENINATEAAALIKCIQKHSKSLRKKHSNVCRISYSGFISTRFGEVDCCVMQNPCITLYVYAKGFIPLGENLLPTTLDIDDRSIPVDVREGFVEVYTGNQGPCDTLDNLKMGCSIGVEPPKNEPPLNGTLGGFFELGGTDFCISSAHVFLSASEMELIREKQTPPILEGSDSAKPVYQPHDNYLIPFGKGRTAIYTEGGNGQTGVDVISIRIENRNPNTGGFPKRDGDDEIGKEYHHGKVYNREEIDNALITDRSRRIYKYGCGTGWTTGRFRTECSSFRAPHPVQGGTTDFSICLHNQFEIFSDTDNDFAGKSDSGALVFMEDNDELVAIGMAVAGMAGEVCFVTPLDEILKAFKLDPKNGLKDFTGRHDRIETDGLSLDQDGGTANMDLTELQSNMSNVTTEVENIKENILDIQSDITDVKSGMDDMKQEMRSDINSVKSEMNDLKNEMKRDINDVKSELKSELKSEINDVKGGIADIMRLLQANNHNPNTK